MEYILFFISCIVIIKAADLLVDSASSLAIKLNVPKTLIALTIVAFGTCAPEIGISFSSIISKNYSMALANVIGSCIVNTLMIIGIAAIFNPIKMKHSTVKKELPLLVFITSIFSILVLDNLFNPSKINTLSRADGVTLLILFCIFVFYLFTIVRNKNTNNDNTTAKYATLKSMVYLLISIILIIVSSNILVDNTVIIAQNLGISEKIITMVLVVIGTSLPELVMTVRAAKKREFDLAIGNIIGTNIFNICIVLGLPIAIFGGFEIIDFNAIDIIMVLFSIFILFIFSKSNKKLSRVEGCIMFASFILYYFYILFI